MVREFIDFARLFNFRDCGGYLTRTGKKVANGKLYRSDNLGSLTSDDFDKFKALGIRTIIDLRPPEEISDWGGPAPKWAAANWRNIPLNNPAWPAEDYSKAEGPIAYLARRYKELLDSSGPEIVRVIKTIANPTAPPVVVHCLGGRDRTGIVIAFTLALLGVSDSEIFSDYQFTEAAHQRRMAWQAKHGISTTPEPAYITETPAAVLQQVFTWLAAKYGSVPGYLFANGLTEIDEQELRATYLAN